MIPINPEAIGDSRFTPVVYLGEENGRALNIPQRTAPCGCTAYDPIHNAHGPSDHTSCGWTGADLPCGGCDSCVSAQVAYFRTAAHLTVEENNHGR
jgi:hypothetical protein